jgi:hypothetical protein
LPAVIGESPHIESSLEGSDEKYLLFAAVFALRLQRKRPEISGHATCKATGAGRQGADCFVPDV